MKTTAFPVSRLQFPSWSGLTTRVPDFIALMKPRVMVLAVFTAAVGLFIAPGEVDPLLGPFRFLPSPREPAPPVCSTCGTTPTSTP